MTDYVIHMVSPNKVNVNNVHDFTIKPNEDLILFRMYGDDENKYTIVRWSSVLAMDIKRDD